MQISQGDKNNDKNCRKTVKSTAAAEYTEKKSRFIAVISHAETEEAAAAFVANVKSAHRKARHNVYAYITGGSDSAPESVRYSEDGEPSGTAPLLPLLQREGLTDVVCVVTRYFGGIPLGTGPLTRAYAKTAAAAVAAAEIVEIIAMSRYTIRLTHADYNAYLRLCGRYAHGEVFTDTVISEVDVPQCEAAAFLTEVKSRFGGRVIIAEL